MKTLTSKDLVLRVRAGAYAIKKYEIEFKANLLDHWGQVEKSVDKFQYAQLAQKTAFDLYKKCCEKYGVDIETGKYTEVTPAAHKEISAHEETYLAATEILQSNYDLEMTYLMQILFAMAMAQAKKDGTEEKDMNFMDWLIEYDEIKLFDIWDDLQEETKSFFSKGGQKMTEKEVKAPLQ